MKYIKPEIEINEILSEDILENSPDSSWGEIISGNGQLGLDDNGDPLLGADASDFVG